jgi:hypothetical protein
MTTMTLAISGSLLGRSWCSAMAAAVSNLTHNLRVLASQRQGDQYGLRSWTASLTTITCAS